MCTHIFLPLKQYLYLFDFGYKQYDSNISMNIYYIHFNHTLQYVNTGIVLYYGIWEYSYYSKTKLSICNTKYTYSDMRTLYLNLFRVIQYPLRFIVSSSYFFKSIPKVCQMTVHCLFQGLFFKNKYKPNSQAFIANAVLLYQLTAENIFQPINTIDKTAKYTRIQTSEK